MKFTHTSTRRSRDEEDGMNLCNELNLAASFNNFALGLFADVSSLDDNWNIWYPTSTKELGVSELKEVDDGSFVFGLLGEVLFAHFFGDKSPELVILLVLFNRKRFQGSADLVQIEDWLPEVVCLTMEVSHADLAEITWVVFVHVYTVMVLSTSEATTTWVLPVLADTTMACRHMPTTASVSDMTILKDPMMTDCFLVFVFLVGIFACGRCEDAVICSRMQRNLVLRLCDRLTNHARTQALRHEIPENTHFVNVLHSFHLHGLPT
jgi:hypothetical protein